jgi:hypothetical protein
MTKVCLTIELDIGVIDQSMTMVFLTI